jgi:sigma-E factor negative regulatory protein RseB
VLESSAFSQVEIGVKPRPQTVLSKMKQLDGYRQVRPVQRATQLQREGWSMASVVPGFQLSSCTLRALDPADGSASNAQVLQTVFSDGLTQVSMFVEAFDRQRHKQPLLTQVGATHTLMQPHGTEWWVTVMGDVPATTLKKIHQALERRR